MKRQIEQLNIWYSESTQQWITCAWLPWWNDHYFHETKHYNKERKAHPTLEAALTFVKENYKEEK